MHIEFNMTSLTEMVEAMELEAQEIDTNLAIAIKEGAKIAQQGMKRRVKKDTRNLENNIHIDRVKNADGQFSIEIGLMRAGQYKVDADTARYGNVLEYGSTTQRAHSYVRTTMLEDNDEMFRAIFEKLKSLGLIGMSE